jgi:hypothetical protein
MERCYGIIGVMDLETYVEQRKVEELTTAESTQATLEYLGEELKYDMTITEVSNWLHKREGWGLDTPKDILWYESRDPDSVEEQHIGIGFVNLSPDPETLPVGIYFKHPRWREGKLCRANNKFDLEFFLYIASKIRRYEEEE